MDSSSYCNPRPTYSWHTTHPCDSELSPSFHRLLVAILRGSLAPIRFILWITLSTVASSKVLFEPWFNNCFKQQCLLSLTPWIQKYETIKPKCLLIRCISQEDLCPGDLFKATILKTASFLEFALPMAPVTHALQVCLPQLYHTLLCGPCFLLLSSSGIESRHSSILTLKPLMSQPHLLPWIQFLHCASGFLLDYTFWMTHAPQIYSN